MFYMDLPKHKKHRLLISLAIALAMISAVITLWIVDRLRFEAREQSRIYKILTLNEALLSSLKDIENGQRGFLLTKDPSYLKPYEDAITNINDQYEELTTHTKDPSLRKLLMDLKPLIDRRLDLIDQILEFERNGQHVRAMETLSSGAGKAYMDQIRLLMAGFKQKELELLNNRSLQFEATVKKLTFAVGITFFLAIVFATALIARIQRLRDDAEHKLSFRNALLRSADIGIVATDTNFIAISVNPAAERLFDLTAERETGHLNLRQIANKLDNILQIIPTEPDKKAFEGDPLQLLTSAVETVHFEASFGIDGTQLSCSITKTRDREGNLYGYILLVSDITNLQNTQEALKDSEQRYKLSTLHLKKIIDTSIDVICTINANGEFVEVGAASRQVWGYMPQELLGKQFIEFVYPDDRPRTNQEAEAIIQGMPTRNFQNRYIRKDGQIVNMMWSAIWSEEDQLMYAVGRDETETIKIATELKASEALLKLAGNVSQVGGWSLDLIKEKFFWTPQVCKILDFPDGVAPTLKERLKLYTEESRTAFLDAMERCRSEGLGFDLQLKTRTKLGRLIDTRLIGQAVTNDLREVIAITGAVQDITEQKKLEQALIEAKENAISANAAKDVFLSTMSHEIRTPLNGLLGMLELLSYSELTREQLDMLTTATDSGKNLIRIINDLLDHSKIESGKLQIINEIVSLPDLINRLQLSYYALASSKNLVLKKSLDPEIASFHMLDSLRLTQILGNLLSNAIKFTASGHVEIRVERLSGNETSEKLKFCVIDTGIGISEEAQKRLFQPFEQASADTTRLYGGTGLGLSISRKLAEMMGGSLELTSYQGRGSEFILTIDLPIVMSPDANFNQEAIVLIDQQVRRGLKVLIVDDHPVNRKLLSRQLAKFDVGVETAENGLDALKKFRSDSYDLVITDCNMPEMDGYQLAKEIRRYEKSRRLNRVPIIAWTANAMADARENVLKAGMDDILIKPSDLPLVKSKILQWTNNTSSRITERKVIDSEVTEKLFDLAQIAETPMEQYEVLTDYCLQTTQDLLVAREACQRRLPDELKRMAHRIKGASRIVGSATMTKLAELLEITSKDQTWELCVDYLSQIDAELTKLRLSMQTNFQDVKGESKEA